MSFFPARRSSELPDFGRANSDDGQGSIERSRQSPGIKLDCFVDHSKAKKLACFVDHTKVSLFCRCKKWTCLLYCVVHFIAIQQCLLEFECSKWVILLQLHIKLSVKRDSLLTILKPQVKFVITIFFYFFRWQSAITRETRGSILFSKLPERESSQRKKQLRKR